MGALFCRLVLRLVEITLDLILEPVIRLCRCHQCTRPIGCWLARHRRTVRLALMLSMTGFELLLWVVLGT
jgi:hypothetical protein